MNGRVKQKIIAITVTVTVALLVFASFTQLPPTRFGLFTAKPEFHCWIMHYRNGELISVTYHPMTLTDYGKDQIEKLLAGESTNPFKYFACSNSSDSVSTSWTSLPGEITGNGLARTAATYTDTGTGTWNMTVTWTVTGANSTKLYGVYATASGDTLCLAEQQGEANQKNLQSGDTLKMVLQGSVSS